MGSNQLRTPRTHAVGRIRELAHNLLHEIFTLPARAITLGDASGAVISMGFGVAVSDTDHDLWVERTDNYSTRCQQCIAHGRFEIVGVLIRPVQKSWRMHLRKPIALPKLHVVLAIFARLDVSPLARQYSQALLRRSLAAVHHEHFVPA